MLFTGQSRSGVCNLYSKSQRVNISGSAGNMVFVTHYSCLLSCKSNHRQYVNKWMWLCSNEVIFTKIGSTLYLSHSSLTWSNYTRLCFIWNRIIDKGHTHRKSFWLLFWYFSAFVHGVKLCLLQIPTYSVAKGFSVLLRKAWNFRGSIFLSMLHSLEFYIPPRINKC